MSRAIGGDESNQPFHTPATELLKSTDIKEEISRQIDILGEQIMDNFVIYTFIAVTFIPHNMEVDKSSSKIAIYENILLNHSAYSFTSGSGWVVKSLNCTHLYITKYTPMQIGRHFALPPALRKKKMPS